MSVLFGHSSTRSLPKHLRIALQNSLNFSWNSRTEEEANSRSAKCGLSRASLTRPVPHLLQVIPPKTDVQLNLENTVCFEVYLQLDDTKFERISGFRVSKKKKKRLIDSETSVIVCNKTVVTLKICTLVISWVSRSRSNSTVFKRVLRAKKKNNKKQITDNYQEEILEETNRALHKTVISEFTNIKRGKLFFI